jgi:hypothetical protein
MEGFVDQALGECFDTMFTPMAIARTIQNMSQAPPA